MSVMSPEKYMELVFLYKNSIGPGAVQSEKKRHLGDFLQKIKMGIVFLLVVPVQVWHNKQNTPYLRELEVLHCFCFLHKHLRKWKAFADYFLLLEDLPHQLSYLCYL